MTKEEIYEFLKADGAKLTKAVQFISRKDLETMFEERFGYPVPEVTPPKPPPAADSTAEENSTTAEDSKSPASIPSDQLATASPCGDGSDQSSEPDEIQNSNLLHDGDDDIPQPPPPEIHLLRFADSGWCEALGRSYTRGLYRPANAAEYLALKPYAAEVL